MNPPIHHPAWYVAGGVLSLEQSEASEKEKELIIVPHLARFSTGRWRIECLLERWTIFAMSESSESEVLDVACSTFERLRETPVSAFGVNYNYLGALLHGMEPFIQLMSTLKLEDYVVRQVGFGRTLEPMSLNGITLQRSLNVQLEVKPENQAVLSLNVHHDIKPQLAGYFDLPPLLRAAHGDAKSVTNSLAKTMLSESEENDVNIS